jgi:penicillin-binding protein 2
MELRELFYNIPPYIFAEDITIRLIALIEERRLPGVIIEAVAAREYGTEHAAHLLGRIGPIFEDEYERLKEQGYPMNASVGTDGIEKAAEPWLRGIDGVKRIETTASGQMTKESYVREPMAGKHVFTTLDIRLQEAVERALERGIETLRATGLDNEGGQAQGGAAVVIDVNSGEILAMASYPSFDLNKFSENYADMLEDPLRPMFNRAIAGTYPPGSTFKMCSALAALESGTITPRTTIFDNVTYMYYAPSYTPKCTGSHGRVDIRVALKVSCNYFFYEMGRLLGISRMEAYASRLGLGQKSGIEIDGERIGTLAGPAYAAEKKLRWFDGDTIQASIGQSYHTFTPLQLAVYTATIANGGTHYRPHLLKSVRSYDFSREAFDIVPEIIDDLNPAPENIKAVQDGMLLATQTGGSAARIFNGYPISVASKTGTAQIATASHPDNGVFVAYAPFENPEIAVAVVVEKGAGGSRVAPIARDIFTAYFEINGKMTNIEPEY